MVLPLLRERRVVPSKQAVTAVFGTNRIRAVLDCEGGSPRGSRQRNCATDSRQPKTKASLISDDKPV